MDSNGVPITAHWFKARWWRTTHRTRGRIHGVLRLKSLLLRLLRHHQPIPCLQLHLYKCRRCQFRLRLFLLVQQQQQQQHYLVTHPVVIQGVVLHQVVLPVVQVIHSPASTPPVEPRLVPTTSLKGLWYGHDYVSSQSRRFHCGAMAAAILLP